MNVWIVSIFDTTRIDNTRPMRSEGIANALLERGFNVTYISSNFRHSTKKYRTLASSTIQNEENLQTIYLKTKSYSRNISLKRFYSHFAYALELRKFLKLTKHKPDIIVSALPPIFLNFVLAKWSKENSIRYYIDIIDPWPDVFLKFVPKRIENFAKFIFSPYKFVLRNILKNSNGYLAISNEYISWANEIWPNSNSYCCYPAIDVLSYKTMIESFNISKSKNVLNVVYAGSLGASYDIPTILSAAESLNSKFPDKIKFHIAGAGQYQDEVERYEKNYQNLKFYGRLNYSDLLKLYAECHVGLSQYREGATQSVTYKLFDYLGAGLPILNSLQSEMKTFIEEQQVGKNNLPGDYSALANNIIHLLEENALLEMQKNAINVANKFGNSKTVYSRFIDNLNS